MLGEVVHNEHVINDLMRRGLKLVKDFNRIPRIKNGILIIQSHGVSKKIYDILKKKNIPYIDSTCLLVKRIHNAIKDLEKEGYFPIIIGNKNHTEVQGIAGQVKDSVIIGCENDIKIDLFKGINKIGVVFQSTFIKKKADRILLKLKKLNKKTKIIDTICKPTKDRQSEIKENAKKHDCVFVIGSKTSANTNHLFEIAKKENKKTYYIENPNQIFNVKLNSTDHCFITSGASTPKHIIDKTFENLAKLMNQFRNFSAYFIPLIDSFIMSFFNYKEEDFSFKLRKTLSSELKEYCLRPGKRVRPLLMILSYLAFKGETNKLKEIIRLAAGIEIMHSFLLIHDDIMDRAPLRRGGKSLHVICQELFSKKTFNNRIGEDVALVLGDIIFADVINWIADSGIDLKIKNSFLKVFSHCYSITGWGQILDSIYSLPKKIKISVAIPERINKFKTAYYTLFYPMYMGYILTGKNNKDIIDKLKKFAIPVGIGFQIRDDIISIFGDQFKTGKSDISDIIDGKHTILIYNTMNLLSKNKQKEFTKLFLKRKKTQSDIKKIKNMIIECGAFDKCLSTMDRLFKQALKQLDMLSLPSAQKNVLNDLIEYLRKIK